MGEVDKLVERVRRLTVERRAHVAEIAQLRRELGRLDEYYDWRWRRPRFVRGCGVYSAWGMDLKDLVV